MEILAIFSIIALFVVTTLIKPRLDRLLPFKFCSICFAVSATWVALLVLRQISIEVNPVLPAILMGGSVVGSMYKIKEYMKSKSYQGSSIVQIVFICLGFLLTYYFLQNSLSSLLLTAVTGLLVGAILWTSFVKNGSPENKLEQKDPLYRELGKKLENCCD